MLSFASATLSVWYVMIAPPTSFSYFPGMTVVMSLSTIFMFVAITTWSLSASSVENSTLGRSSVPVIFASPTTVTIFRLMRFSAAATSFSRKVFARSAAGAGGAGAAATGAAAPGLSFAIVGSRVYARCVRPLTNIHADDSRHTTEASQLLHLVLPTRGVKMCPVSLAFPKPLRRRVPLTMRAARADGDRWRLATVRSTQ